MAYVGDTVAQMSFWLINMGWTGIWRRANDTSPANDVRWAPAR